MTDPALLDLDLSLIRNDLPFRVQRRLGLIPEGGLGIVRRAIFFALLTWLPLVPWAALKGRAIPGLVAEPLLQHFGIHVHFLLAVPLLILGESGLHRLLSGFIPYFLTSGLIRPEQRPDFKDILRQVVALRDRTMPWLMIAILGATQAFLEPLSIISHELNGAAEEPGTLNLGFAGWWFHFVSRPIFTVLAVGWWWRLALLVILLKRIAKLDLALVPTHPDRAGGLGFLEKLPSAFSLFGFALSAVVASRLAHEVLYHGSHVADLMGLLAIFVLAVTGLCLLPLPVFAGPLGAAKRPALLDYGALVGEHGRLVHQRWIERRALPDDSLLSAPELGPVADTRGLFDAVVTMKLAPIGKAALLSVAIPVAVPLLALLSMEIPLKDLLKDLLAILL